MADGKKCKMKNIRAIILDVDGVLTDGKIILGGGNAELKSFHVQDGMAITIARNCGIKIGFVTNRTSEATEKRAKELKINYLFQGVKDKLSKLREISRSENIPLKNICYVGDDITDIPALQRVGFSATVFDAPKEIKSRVSYVSKNRGGNGAVRDIIETILTCQGKWEKAINSAIKHAKTST